MAVVDTPPLRRRVARLSWLSVALIGLTIGCCCWPVWIALRAEPRDIVGQLPLGADDNVPSASLILAAVAAAARSLSGWPRCTRRRRCGCWRGTGGFRLRFRRRCAGCAAWSFTPLGPSTVRLAEEPELPAGQVARWRGGLGAALRLTVLVPAHDEALTIAATLESLWGQTRPPDRVVVVADNCTDDTAESRGEHGAEVFTTVGNTEKKAGALNQALSRDVRRDRRRATS